MVHPAQPPLTGKGACRGCERRNQPSDFLLSTCRPRYMPVFRSIWCGRRNSPESLSSTYVGAFRASADRRMPRLDGDVFLFGTAMAVLLFRGFAAKKAAYRRRNGLRLGHDREKWVPVFGKE